MARNRTIGEAWCARFVAQPIGKLGKGEWALAGSHDRYTLEIVTIVLEHKAARRSFDTQGHIFADDGLGGVLADRIDAHARITLHLAHKVLPVEGINPAIGIDQLGNRRSYWQHRTGNSRWLVVTRHALMRSLEIVVLPKGRRNSLDTLTISGPLDLQAFLVIGAMIALHNSLYAIDKTGWFRCADWSG